jgi:hypothetical protein
MDSDHSVSAVFSLLPDGISQTFGNATVLGTVVCGATITVSGTTTQLGESDWLQFTVPSGCTQTRVAISGSGGEVFDINTDAQTVIFSGGGPTQTFLNNPGTYYIHVYNIGGYICNVGCGTGLWTITVAVT